jgi:S1-C subfamily serine protease
MIRKLLLLSLLVCATASRCPETIAAPQPEPPTLARCEELIDSLLPSIVQISYDGFVLGCGVVVSPDGHVVVSSFAASALDTKLLELRFADGRQVTGKALGWSNEFGFGLLKIVEPGKWPFVKLSEQVRAGEVCLALGYNLNHEGKNYRPVNRLAVVTRVSRGAWFTTSYQSEFSSHPVFSMKGELLGLANFTIGGDDAVYNCSSVIDKHLNDLEAGRSLDRKRLLDETRPPEKFETLPEKMNEKTLAKAKAASVQIGDVGKRPKFSGVIIRDEFVITCAHHYRLPGAELEIALADGRSAKAVVVSTNWITDVCVLKITDDGGWPFVDLGYSSVVADGKPALLIGYPHSNNQKPLILESRVAESKYELERRDPWSDKLFLAFDREQITGDIGGASGGGIFDSSGNVIGVLSARMNDELRCPRVELFHRNWTELATTNTAEEIDSELRGRVSPIIDKLMSDLKIRNLKP